MRRPDRALLIAILMLAIGVGLGRAGQVVLHSGQIRPLTEEPRFPFTVVCWLDGEPQMVQLTEIPEGATFYFKPETEDQVGARLAPDGRVRVRSFNHSGSNKEQDVLLEVRRPRGLFRFRYRASLHSAEPTGFTLVGPNELKAALGQGFRWFGLTLLALPLAWFTPRSAAQHK